MARVQRGDGFCSGRRPVARPELLQVKKAKATNEEKRGEQKAKERKGQGKEEKPKKNKKKRP